jgi:predicted metal-dependent peptidase
MSNALQRVIAARAALVLSQPFFGSLALKLKLREDRTCKTLWTDGQTLGFNPAFIDSLSPDRLKGSVAHEVMHCALGHPWRRGGRDQTRWNVACDKPINSGLLDAGFILPDGVLYAEGDEVGKSAEWVFSHLPPPDQQPQGSEESEEEDEESGEDESEGDDGESGEDESDEEDDGTGDGESDEEGGDSDGEGNGEGNSESGEDEGEGDPMGEVRDAPAGTDGDGDAAPSEQEWKDAVATAAALANAQGDIPAGMARAIEDALKPRVDVRSLVLRFMQETAASDYTWTRPNPRYAVQGLYLPALHSKQLGEVAIMVDTSGSIDDVALNEARGIVQSVLDECNPAGITQYFADAEVCNVQRMERGEPLAWEPKGGGGTDFRPALEAIEQDENQPVCVICITDLEGTFPEFPPEVPVLWLATKERGWNGEELIAPFGEQIYVGG